MVGWFKNHHFQEWRTRLRTETQKWLKIRCRAIRIAGTPTFQWFEYFPRQRGDFGISSWSWTLQVVKYWSKKLGSSVLWLIHSSPPPSGIYSFFPTDSIMHRFTWPPQCTQNPCNLFHIASLYCISYDHLIVLKIRLIYSILSPCIASCIALYR